MEFSSLKMEIACIFCLLMCDDSDADDSDANVKEIMFIVLSRLARALTLRASITGHQQFHIHSSSVI